MSILSRGHRSRRAARAAALSVALLPGITASLTASASAQTVINGSALALRSSGTVSGTSATLSQNGYFGTYVQLAQPGQITFNAVANGAASNGVNPNLTFALGDVTQTFTVVPGTNGTYAYTTPTLAAGTYFVRTQLDNHKTLLVNNAPVIANTTLTLGSLSVSPNATVLNQANDANALAAADTYIANYRKGDATLKLVGASAGDAVRVRLKSNAFKLGTYVSGGYSTTDNYLQANPAAGSDAARFQGFIDGRFNAIVPSNAGKWDPNASVSSTNVSTFKVGMGINDQMMAYADGHGMAARQHTLIWGNQQPMQVRTWLNTIVSTSTSVTAAQKAAAQTNLKAAITNRINYYIKAANTVDGKTRAAHFQQLDVLNEALQTGNYFRALGYNAATNTITTAQAYAGVAEVYKEVQDAVKAVGLTTRLYTNEYNVLQNSPIFVTASNTFGGQGAATYGDQYANWYRNEIEGINNAAIANGSGGNVVTGIGFQYYPITNGARGPAVMQNAVQNLAVAGLPMTLTEFGGQTSIRSESTANGDPASKIVDDTIRMMMGTAGVDSMLIWGWYDDGTASTNPYGGGTVLLNRDGTLTAAGRRFEYLYGRGLDPTAPGADADGSNPNPWTTDLTLAVGPDGTVDFNGFYGQYVVTIGGRDYDLSFDKGGSPLFTLIVPEPATLVLLGVAGLLGRCARRRSTDL